MLKNRFSLLLSLCLLASLPVAEAAPPDDTETRYSKLDKYQTPVPYAGQRNWHVCQNLGATGARGWMEGQNGHTRHSREIIIRSVTPGSPADGVLQPYDIILGIDKTPFASDARMAFARALTVAEGTKAGGKLKLLRWRDGVTETVTVTLPVMGDYSPDGPHNCPKTRKIVKEAAALLAQYMPDKGFGSMQGGLNGMLLLASQDVGYLDHVRRTAMNMGPNHTITDAGHETWRWGYCNLFLCEYYLATGDKRVLPTIAQYSDVLVKGQCHPGTWGHRAVPDGIPPGYGSMNQSGLVCFLSLVLAAQCGVEFDHQALANSIKFYGRYAGWGGIPYGDHPAYLSPSCNGKNGSAAVAFYLLGAEPVAQWFARLCASTNLFHFEAGHTGNYFSQIWTPIAASVAGPVNYRNFWARHNSYRDLARFWKGGFLTQSFPQYREGDLGSSNSSRGPAWSTGGFTLGYLGGSNRLAVLGRRESVFAVTAPASVKPALELYRQKHFAESAAAAAKLAPSSQPRVKAMARQLKEISERNLKSCELTLSAMQKNLEAGDFYLVQTQLQALEAIVEKDDQKLAPFRKALADPANAEIIESRGRFYEGLVNGGFGTVGLKGFWELPVPPIDSSWLRKKLPGLQRDAKGFYQQQAQATAKALGQPDKVTDLIKRVTVTAKAPEAQQTFTVNEVADIKRLHAVWGLSYGRMKVLLNDTVILDLTVGGASKETEILLKPITLTLLKKGENTLKVICESDDKRKRVNATCLLKAIQ